MQGQTCIAGGCFCARRWCFFVARGSGFWFQRSLE